MPVPAANIAEFRIPGENSPDVTRDDLNALTRLLARYAPHDDRFDLNRDGLHVVRSSQTMVETTYTLAIPGICIVPQGSKAVTIGGNHFEYDEYQMAVYAAEIPINVRITKASADKPYYCLVIPIDPARLSELILKVFPCGLPKAERSRAVYVGDTHPKIVKCAVRMMELIAQQEDVDLLVPLVVDEILIRLLRSPCGPALSQIGIANSHAEKVAKAISWLKVNYSQPIKMEDLAKIAGMSVSSFHTHFKSITDMSPLQFQKTLRLQEARRLIRTRFVDVSSAAFNVGYASTTQFSREYSRFFGTPPSKDLLR